MRQKTVHYLFLVVLMGIGLAGCKSDVKLDDLTVDGKIKAKLDLPIGEVTTTFGDLIGLMKFDEKTNVIINENGIHEDFLDIDTDKLYEQYPDVFYLVSPYTDRSSNIRNN